MGTAAVPVIRWSAGQLTIYNNVPAPIAHISNSSYNLKLQAYYLPASKLSPFHQKIATIQLSNSAFLRTKKLITLIFFAQKAT